MQPIFEAVLQDDKVVAQQAGTVQEQIEIIELLLAHAADPNAKDDRGRTVLDWTKNQQLLEVIQKKNWKSSSSKSGR